MDSGQRFRILALDGGGIRGAFTAGVLMQLEKSTGQRFVEHFDLIVGTSTGGILAIGLGLGIEVSAILDLYCKRGAKIFSNRTWIERKLAAIRHFHRPKHSEVVLKSVLSDVFGDKKLGESSVRLVIPTFGAGKGTACTFKTAHHELLRFEHNKLAVDIAMATAAAPTYFKAAALTDREGETYVDGGVWANCPVIVGIVEAIHFLQQSLDEIHVLSIGTTKEILEFATRGRSGIIGWNEHVVNVMMAGQVTSAQAQAKLLLGERYHRIDALTQNGLYEFDDGRAVTATQLAGLGRSVARSREHYDIVNKRFLDGVPASRLIPNYLVTPTG